MNGPTRTHVFEKQPTLPELLRVWLDYGEPRRVEVSRALHTGFIAGPHSDDYRAWNLTLTERVIAEDDMRCNPAFWLRVPIEIPGGDMRGSPAPRLPVPERDRKDSTGKLLMNLVTSDLVRQAAAADTYGAEKYGEPGSWRNAPVEDVVRYVDAAERHLSDVKAALVEGKGDRWLAEDSKLAHLAHLAASVGILIEFAQRMGLALPEEFDRHWLRDPSDDRIAAKIAERELRGARIMSDVSGELAPDATGVPE